MSDSSGVRGISPFRAGQTGFDSPFSSSFWLQQPANFFVECFVWCFYLTIFFVFFSTPPDFALPDFIDSAVRGLLAAGVIAALLGRYFRLSAALVALACLILQAHHTTAPQVLLTITAVVFCGVDLSKPRRRTALSTAATSLFFRTIEMIAVVSLLGRGILITMLPQPFSYTEFLRSLPLLGFALYYLVPRLRKIWFALVFALWVTGIYFNDPVTEQIIGAALLFAVPCLVVAPALLGRLKPLNRTNTALREKRVPVLIIDGDCPLCFSSIRFLLTFDERASFLITSFGSPVAAALGYHQSASGAFELLLVDCETGALIARGPWAAIAVFRGSNRLGYAVGTLFFILPRQLIETCYRWIAERRRQLVRAGTLNANCEIPPKIFRSRIV